MSKKADREKQELKKRSEDFENFYSEIYKERWPRLKAALLEDSSPVAFSENLTNTYYLDKASIIVASMLPLKKGDNVLDMCAAPGGKTLVLLSRMNGEITITANDRSRDRRARLDQVLKEHTPDEWHENITTTCHDASRWGLYEKDMYDAILLDAPCSSERHVIKSDKHMAMWSLSRPKRLAIEQFALLAAALDAVKSGGYILYSTCSINSEEDEKVIEKLLKRREGLVEVIPISHEEAETRPYGLIILPDRSNNLGPLYCCLLRKL